MAQCNIEGALKLIEKLYKEASNEKDAQYGKQALKDIFDTVNTQRALLQEASTFAGAQKLNINTPLKTQAAAKKAQAPSKAKSVASTTPAPAAAQTSEFEPFTVEDVDSLVDNKGKGLSILKELFRLNKKFASKLYGAPTTFVVSDEKSRGGVFNRKNNILTLYGQDRDNESTSHELIHSLQGTMVFDQLSQNSKEFVYKTINKFLNFEVGVDEATYKEVLEKMMKREYDNETRDLVERVYLTAVVRGDYHPDATEDQNLERFGREFTAIIGSSPAFRKAMYGNTAKEDRTPFKMLIEDVLKAIKNVKGLIEKILKEDPADLADSVEYNSALVLLDEYLKGVDENGTTDPNSPITSPVAPEPGKPYKIAGSMVTNEGQTTAINAMIDWFKAGVSNTFLLQGRGGTGKTTVINVLLRELGLHPTEVAFAAPTNKAKKVLEQANKTTVYGNNPYYTVAQLLGIKPEMDDDGNQTFRVDPYAEVPDMPRVLVVDEASMLHSENYAALLDRASSTNTKIIFMGDNAQLPPIGDPEAKVKSVVFEANQDSTVALNQLMRQGEGSPIIGLTDKLIRIVNRVEKFLGEGGSLQNAKTSLRKVLFDGAEFTKFDPETNEGVVLTDSTFDQLLPSFLKDFKKSPQKTKYINFNNYEHSNTIQKTNMIRTALYGSKASEEMFIEGEPLMLNAPAVLNPEYGKEATRLDNGEEFTVVSSRITKKRIYYVVGNTVIQTAEPMEVYEITATDNVSGTKVTFDKPVGNKQQVKAFIENEKSNAIANGVKPGGAYMLLGSLATGLSHGYIINSHRSQGSTYDNVYMDLGNIAGQYYSQANDIIKSLYVAASRPRKKLIVVDTRDSGNQIENPSKASAAESKPAAFENVDNAEANDIINKIDKCKGE